MNKVLISGVSGFVGSNIFNEITPFFKTLMLNRKIIPESKNEQITYDDFESFDIHELKQKIGQIDTFIHVASEIDFNNFNIQLTHFNISTFHKLLVKLKALEVKKIILISSAPISGKQDGELINEDHCANPRNLYHFSKYAQEKILEFLSFEHYYCLRISSPIGPGLKKKTIFSVLIEKALKAESINLLGNGKRVQNYIDVRDVARICLELTRGTKPSGAYNICSNLSISNKDFAELVIKVLKSDSQIKFEGIDKEEDDKWIFNTTKTSQVLGFESLISIEKSIIDYASIS